MINVTSPENMNKKKEVGRRDVSEVPIKSVWALHQNFRRSSPRTFVSFPFYTYHTWYQVYSLTPVINTSCQKLPFALETAQISSYFTKHCTKFLSRQGIT